MEVSSITGAIGIANIRISARDAEGVPSQIRLSVLLLLLGRLLIWCQQIELHGDHARRGTGAQFFRGRSAGNGRRSIKSSSGGQQSPCHSPRPARSDKQGESQLARQQQNSYGGCINFFIGAAVSLGLAPNAIGGQLCMHGAGIDQCAVTVALTVKHRYRFSSLFARLRAKLCPHALLTNR